MSSLADLPEVVGFFSYSREDDEDSEGALSTLRVRIQRELSTQLGRSKANFRLWQDQEAIAPGTLWESEIKRAVEQAVFFIPIVTPRAITSHYCKFEFDAFLAREQELGRANLVFPLLYIRVPALDSEARWRTDPVLSIVGMRQYVDWRPLRHLDVRTPTVREQIACFCDKIAEALREPWISPEERQKKQEVEAQVRAEAERRAQATRLAEEERQRAEAAQQAEEAKRRAEALRHAEEAKRLAEEQKRRKQPPPEDKNRAQLRSLRFQVRSFVDDLKYQTEIVTDPSDLLNLFKKKFLDAVILRDELKNSGAESILPRSVYLHPQSTTDISDILDELEYMARRL